MRRRRKVILFYAVLSYAICDIMLWYVSLCNIMPCHAVLWYVILYVIMCYGMSYCVVVYYTICYNIVLCSAIITLCLTDFRCVFLISLPTQLRIPTRGASGLEETAVRSSVSIYCTRAMVSFCPPSDSILR